MRSKIIFTVCAVMILNIAPLIFRPDLILNYKTVTLCIAAAVLWLSQPAFSANEMQNDKKNDKLSVLLILLTSSISVFASVTEWAYITENKSEINFMTLTGLFLLLTGIVIRVWSIQILGKHFTATVKVTEKHSLIRSGPYNYIRHPGYFGALLAITGCPVFLNDTFSIFIAFFAMLFAYYFRIKFEEKALRLHFGEEYEAYKKNTFGLLPLIW